MATAGAAFLARLVKDQVMGDSLDIPYVKWIRVHDFKHEISFPRKELSFEKEDDHGNLFIGANGANPRHEQVKIQCLAGKQTPQLAFGCMAQEKFPLALICFRRHTGFGYEVRFPHLMVGLKDCLIADWSIGGSDIEECSLWYNKIVWSANSQLADTNMPNPMTLASIGAYDKTNNTGATASDNFAKFVFAFGNAITLAADAVVAASDLANKTSDY